MISNDPARRSRMHDSGPVAQLISIPTDTYPLDGLFYEAPGNVNGKCAVIFHGNCMNFYTGPSQFLPATLIGLGFHCLTFNRRGHDIVATLNSRQAVGGAYQMTQEAIEDNRLAAQWLQTRGFRAPVVIGHSNGGMLAIKHASEHPETPGLILLSAHRGGTDLVPMISRAGLLGGPDFETHLQRAKEYVRSGRGKTLMKLPGWWYAIAAESFVDYCTELPDSIDLARKVTCPSLLIRGSQESPDIYPSEEFAARTPGACETHIIADCDHFYTAHQPIVCNLIARWLSNAIHTP